MRINSKYNFICIKDKLTARSNFIAYCPKCREKMKCIGFRWRIGKNKKFDKIEGSSKKANWINNI